MPDFQELQLSFHQKANANRFWNRISNPFLQAKERRLAAKISSLMPSEGKHLLEVGCGEGSNLHYLKEFLPHARMVGLDFSQKKVHFFSIFTEFAAGVCGDAVCLPFNDTSFDLVFCRDLLHHVNWARDQVISESLRVVKPGGKVVILEANGRTFLNRLFQLLFPGERGMKDSHPESLLALGRQFGETDLEFMEGSMFLRATSFHLGWPTGWTKHLLKPLYFSAYLWEKLIERLLPQTRWSYMMVTVKRR